MVIRKHFYLKIHFLFMRPILRSSFSGFIFRVKLLFGKDFRTRAVSICCLRGLATGFDLI